MTMTRTGSRPINNELPEVSTTIASRKRNTALSLNTHSNSTSNPLNTLIRTLLMRISHPRTSLLHRPNTSSELTSVTAVSPRSSNNNTSFTIVHGTADSDGGLSSPGARVVDTKAGAETVLDGFEIETCADGNAVGDAERGCDADVDAAAAGADDDGGHLHVPVDEALGAVGHVGGGGAAGLTFLEIAGSNGLRSGVEPVLVDFRSDGGDAL